jgi:LmbE family N-acetylglucosaminyl deacetylase
MIRFHNEAAELFVPDGIEQDAALGRTTHMAVGAHPDDIAIMAYHGIDECFGRTDRWFCAVTATDGAGSPRADAYASYSDDEMRRVRSEEEKKAAVIGEYGAVALLGYSSSEAKDADTTLVEELAALIATARPRVMYTHNLADRHDTHVAVALRTIEALRLVTAETRPEALYGCEVWRDLDWLVDGDKVVFDVSARPNLAASLIGVYDSQISGGKRYDIAAAGRWAANATYSQSHQVDTAAALVFAMDLTPLISDDVDPVEHVDQHLSRLRSDVIGRIERLSTGATE